MKLKDWQWENIKHLEFAIYLCLINLDASREGDWLNLRDGLVEFLFGRHNVNSRGGDSASAFSKNLAEAAESRLKQELTPEVIGEIQQRFKEILLEIAAHKQTSLRIASVIYSQLHCT